MKLGVHCSNLTWPGGAAALAPTLAKVARTADDGGVTTLTMMDHYFQMEILGGPPEPMLEGYTSLGFLAGQTSQIELGLLVTGVTYRHPGLLAKIVTTLDVLSGGRAMFGIGAAWYEREHLGFGVPFPATSERFERLEETLQIVRQGWHGGGSYDGRHYQLADLTLVPQPVQPGGPRVMVGGSGERKTLRLVAQYADACNLFATEPQDVQHKLDVLRSHCDDVGRDYDQIAKTIVASRINPLTDLDAWLSSMTGLATLGIEQVWTAPDPADPVGWTERMADQVIPRLAQIG
ncbi:MAG TPA: LLM class F420-dependent oxidoreductase [Nocardioides sp.]|jgi:F420-dependent oxidoreductase-like protein|uniref:LLM class F420-dependent oxidoreductase n=1 Tax=Nocardioides sp. TaxID=35761 RepID=UPI002E3127D5|nr:LLM class F420-dependent oxidoreductase [Nocardioides sp.]HEX3929894.1 LLM class F420-dependent oxidoreductase [Nocardioides sp.]